MIIDSHCHGGAGFGLVNPWSRRPFLESYLRRARKAGITGTVLFANFHGDYSIANRKVADFIRRSPQRCFGLAFVHAQRDRGRIRAMVRTAVEDYGFVGIKVHRHDAPISREVCSTAREFGLPVLYDVQEELPMVDRLAKECPDLTFIIPHLSSFNENWRAQSAFLDQLERYPNIYTDTSGVRFFDLVQRAVERCGPEKVLFGSDGPWLHPAVELAKIRALRLPPDQESLILGGNFLRLIGGTRLSAGGPSKNPGELRPLPCTPCFPPRGRSLPGASAVRDARPAGGRKPL
jgi:uncharacterized protein